MLSKRSVLFFIFLFLSISTYFIIDSLKETKISQTKDIIFNDRLDHIGNTFDSLYNKFQSDALARSQKIMESLDVINYIQKPDKNFSYYNSEDTLLKIYDAKGKLLFTNEEFINGTDQRRFHIEHFIKDPGFTQTFLTTTKGLTLTQLFPLMKKEFIGVVQIDYRLDELIKQLDKKDIKALVLLNRSLSSVIDVNLSYSRNFIKERYVVNKNADKYYQKLLEQSNFIKSNKESFIDKKDGLLITKKAIIADNKTIIGEIYLIKSIDNINLELTNSVKNFYDIITILLLVIYSLIIYFIHNSYQTRSFALENEKLLKDNMKLSILSDQLDYNEKKLSNLFNLQPNIMFISNGVDIVQVNKRFMGFFRRYKTFDNFKKHHKDISELFEPCENPNYISTELIEGKNWLEYILENPKRLYKTIMSVDNEQHHFIIKVNEMDYVRNFQGRYIVVAFVDITQDVAQKEEIKVQPKETDPLDISYLIENTLSYTIKEFINIMPTKQAIFKADENELDELGAVLIDLQFTKDDQEIKWQFLLPAMTVSFIINQLTSNYDERLNHDIDKEMIKTASSFVNSFSSHINYELEQLNHIGLSGMKSKILKDEEYTLENKHRLNNLYKFVMFVEEQELNVYINFDDGSMKYLNQIYMLGMFFDS